jgi:hypothetical protein
MGRIEREQVAFPSAPDPRFGGNISNANVGAQYPRGGHDVRYENYQRPQQVDYTRNVPRQTGTPNFRPPYGAPGQPSYPEWMQQIDPFHTGPYPPKKHPNPRMRGMMGGLGGLEEQAAIPNWYKWYDKLINRFGKERGSELWHQYASDDTGIGSTNEYQMAELLPAQIEHMQASDPNKTNLTRRELFNQVKEMEDKGAAGWFGTNIGARDPQEPTTWDEFNEKYDWLEGGGSPYGSEPHTKSYWIT